MLTATKKIPLAFWLLHLLCDMLFSSFHVFLIGDDYEKWFFILPFYSMNVTLIISPDMDPIHIEWTPISWLRCLPQVVWNIKIVLKYGLVLGYVSKKIWTWIAEVVHGDINVLDAKSCWKSWHWARVCFSSCWLALLTKNTSDKKVQFCLKE